MTATPRWIYVLFRNSDPIAVYFSGVSAERAVEELRREDNSRNEYWTQKVRVKR